MRITIFNCQFHTYGFKIGNIFLGFHWKTLISSVGYFKILRRPIERAQKVIPAVKISDYNTVLV